MYTQGITFNGRFSILTPKTSKKPLSHYTAHNGIKQIYEPPKPTKMQQFIKNIKFFFKLNNPFRKS